MTDRAVQGDKHMTYHSYLVPKKYDAAHNDLRGQLPSRLKDALCIIEVSGDRPTNLAAM